MISNNVIAANVVATAIEASARRCAALRTGMKTITSWVMALIVILLWLTVGARLDGQIHSSSGNTAGEATTANPASTEVSP